MSQFFNKYSSKNFANPNIFDSSPSTSTALAERTELAAVPASQGAAGTGAGPAAASPRINPFAGRPTESAEKSSDNTNAQAQKTLDNGGGGGVGGVRAENSFKHPLQNTWTLWYLEADRSKSWEDLQNEITSFDTVEDFWSLYNHIKPPSEIKSGSDYSLFKKGIRPMWEDEANKKGGRWVINLNKFPKTDLDTMWLDVLLCLIGEAFDNSEEICGAVVNNRMKNNKISIWTANGNNDEAILEIGHKLREALQLGRSNLQYQLHKDTILKQGSTVKSVHNL